MVADSAACLDRQCSKIVQGESPADRVLCMGSTLPRLSPFTLQVDQRHCFPNLDSDFEVQMQSRSSSSSTRTQSHQGCCILTQFVSYYIIPIGPRKDTSDTSLSSLFCGSQTQLHPAACPNVQRPRAPVIRDSGTTQNTISSLKATVQVMWHGQNS